MRVVVESITEGLKCLPVHPSRSTSGGQVHHLCSRTNLVVVESTVLRVVVKSTTRGLDWCGRVHCSVGLWNALVIELSDL